jgi:hypothetical protein
MYDRVCIVVVYGRILCRLSARVCDLVAYTCFVSIDAKITDLSFACLTNALSY